jgi:hypothetical protein
VSEDPRTSPEALLELLESLVANARRPAAPERAPRVRAKTIGIVLGTFAVFALGTSGALLASGVLHDRGGDGPNVAERGTVARRHPVGAPSVPGQTVPETSVASQPAPRPAPRAPSQARLEIRATRGASWVMARAGSATGRVLYSGLLARGKTLRLHGRALWVRFGALAYLDLSLGGKPITLHHSGTVDALFTPSGASAG